MTEVNFPWDKNMVDHIVNQTGCIMPIVKGDGMLASGYVRNEVEANKRLNLLPSSSSS